MAIKNRYLITLEIEADTPRAAARIILTMPIQLLMTGTVVNVVDADTGEEHHVDTSEL